MTGLVLHPWRVLVQDKKRLAWTDDRPYLADAAAVAVVPELE